MDLEKEDTKRKVETEVVEEMKIQRGEVMIPGILNYQWYMLCRG